jgi:uncharacterized membrane protein YhdT
MIDTANLPTKDICFPNCVKIANIDPGYMTIIYQTLGASMDARFRQAGKEAIFALILTVLYLFGWLVTAYLADNAAGITGLPHWFELSCLLLPLVFIGLCWLMIRYLFRSIPLE